MGDLMFLSEAQMRRIEPYFRCNTACRALMTDSIAALSLFCAAGCGGVTLSVDEDGAAVLEDNTTSVAS
jgi:hypothetical protein